ncbi:hypothetical protein BDE02_10G181000 [Populus trichocarpa]|uniref:Uncharacterized protein n=1 Tax=Populus trichocarpa TaxID=3694 RepID=B9HTH6_POPTR|nr:hypothetical protein BDE02_10G181000 [Populus trichocarpa]
MTDLLIFTLDMSPHVKFILYFSFCIDLIFLQDFFLYMHVLFLLWGSIFCSVFSFNNRAIEKALLLHFLFKSRKFCFLEAGEVIRQRPDNRRDDSTDDGLLIPLCLLIPSHISYFDCFNVG